MLIGNKSRIAFEFLEIQEEHAVVNMYLANTNITPTDNSHYYSIIINGLKKDIKELQNIDLTLKDKYKILNLPELYEVTEEGKSIYYENMHLDCFYYDLSVSQGFFYFYQHIDDLIFFGKLHGEHDVKSCKISKSEYFELLQKLLQVLTDANPHHYAHSIE